MRLLLDTHALLWWASDDERLKPAERDAIGDEDSSVWVSAASIWEISIKRKLGRIELVHSDLERELKRSSFLELAIAWQHAESAGSLPRHHDDPFDRMLIAQAQAEQLVLVSYDPAFRDYDVALRPAPLVRNARLQLLEPVLDAEELPFEELRDGISDPR